MTLKDNKTAKKYITQILYIGNNTHQCFSHPNHEKGCFNHLLCHSSTNICENMSCSHGIIRFQCGSVIGLHQANRSYGEMSLLLSVTEMKLVGTRTSRQHSGEP